MFDWLGDIFSGIGNLLGDALASLGESISNSIFDAILRWWYEMIYNAVADFFSQMKKRTSTWSVLRNQKRFPGKRWKQTQASCLSVSGFEN